MTDATTDATDATAARATAADPGAHADHPAPTVQDLVLTEEQVALRDVSRSFLADRMPMARVRALMATETAFDPDLWAAVGQLGWHAMAVPESHGGAGFGWVEIAVVFEELGRAMAAVPLLSTTMATATLHAHGTDDQHDRLLPACADGSLRLTIAVPVSGAGDGATIVDDDRGHTLQGHVTHVLDAASADAVIVATDMGTALVPLDRSGVRVIPLDVLDQTRPMARLDFAGVPLTEQDMLRGAPDDVVATARTIGAVLLANELVGVATAAHAMAVDYAKVRTQFGRAIGSFQAVKHMLADDLVELEAARSLAWWAARVMAADDDVELGIAVPMAAAACPDMAITVTGHAIQVHGGIGFTWEHDAHLYYKRASAARPLFGHATAWRAELATTLGLR